MTKKEIGSMNGQQQLVDFWAFVGETMRIGWVQISFVPNTIDLINPAEDNHAHAIRAEGVYTGWLTRL